MNEIHDDEGLRQRVRRVDPATSLAPLDDHRKAKIMATISDAQPDTTPQRTVRRRRGFVLACVGLAAAAGIGVVTVTSLTGGDVGIDMAVLQQPAADGPAVACAPVEAAALQDATIAFEGTVTAIDGQTVTLSVDQEFRGELGESVQVQQGAGEPSEFTIGVLEAGSTYLISATGDVIDVCGQSGPATPELEAIYVEAFQ